MGFGDLEGWGVGFRVEGPELSVSVSTCGSQTFVLLSLRLKDLRGPATSVTKKTKKKKKKTQQVNQLPVVPRRARI